MIDTKSFGQFISEMREKHSMKKIELAKLLGVSRAYLSQLESGTRCNPSLKLLNKIADKLCRDSGERNRLFDLYAVENQTISPDIIEYIISHPTLVEAVRTAQDKNIPDEIWKIIVEQLNK